MSIDWNAFTPASALIGGVIIGAPVALFVVLNGRIAGVSGILGGLARPQAGGIFWRGALLLGPPPPAPPPPPPPAGGPGGTDVPPRGAPGRLRVHEEADTDPARCAGAHPEPAPHRPAAHLGQPRVRRGLGTGRHLP